MQLGECIVTKDNLCRKVDNLEHISHSKCTIEHEPILHIAQQAIWQQIYGCNTSNLCDPPSLAHKKDV
jgi:hypothetical protein